MAISNEMSLLELQRDHAVALLPKNWAITLAARGGSGMASKRHSDDDLLKLLRELELKLKAGDAVTSVCRSVGISDAT